jgi:hypothetical protein
MAGKEKKMMATLSNFLRILRYLLTPYYRNYGGWNVDSVLVILGGFAWFICVVGEGYGIAKMPPTLAGVGPFITGIGVGGARYNYNKPRQPHRKS